MQVLVSPTFAEVSGRIPANFMDPLQEALQYTERQYRKFPEPRWESRTISLLQRQADRLIFPAGLVHRVLALADKLGVPYERTLVDLPELGVSWTTATPTGLPTRLVDGTELYPDQIEALRCALQSQRGLLALATNFGKTILAAAIFTALEDCRGLFIVNRRVLLNQVVRDFERLLGVRPGIFGAGSHQRSERTWSSRVTVAMAQSLYRHRKKPETRELLEKARVLVVDEVHVVSPKMWYPILGVCRAPFRIGMSGTVKEVEHPLPVEAFFGPILMEVQEAELVAAGRSAEPTIMMPAAGAVVQDNSNFHYIYMEGIVRNEQRNILLVNAVLWAKSKGRRCVVLFYRIEHGERLYELLVSAGVEVTLLHGQSAPREIQEAIQALDSRRLDAIVASVIFNTGVNLPAVEVWVNAAAWKSPLATKQKLGRALRRKLEGENRVFVVDPWDYGARMLKRHSEAREKLYRRQGFPVYLGDLGAMLANKG